MATFTITGVREAQDALRRLGRDVRQETAPILLGGATVMRDSIRGEAVFSSRTGAMQRAIISKLSGRTSETLPVAFAALDLRQLTKRDKRGKIVRYPYYVEYGVGPHEIRAKDGSALSYRGSAVARVKHPGFAGRGFFRSGLSRGRYRTKRKIEGDLVGLLRRYGAETGI